MPWPINVPMFPWRNSVRVCLQSHWLQTWCYILDDQIEIKIQPKSGYMDDNPMKMKVSFNQINSTLPNDRSSINGIADNPHNHVQTSIVLSMPIVFLASLISMFM